MILNHQPHRQLLNASGILAERGSQVRKVRVKVAAAGAAAVLTVRELQLDPAPADRVPAVVQPTLADLDPAGRPTAPGTRTNPSVTAKMADPDRPLRTNRFASNALKDRSGL
jgi:hypothetical protein